MKKITLSLFSIAVLAFAGQMTAQQAEIDPDYNQNPAPGNTEIINTGTHYQVAGGVIYSNGPYFSVAGGGSGGADLSLLETTSLGMNTLGAGHQTSAGNRVADDWELTDNVEVTSIDFYAYQTGSTTTSTMLGVTLLVWDGDPSDPASSVIFGDDAISAMISTEWSGAYRASEGNESNIDRPIMRNTVETPGLTLAPGTYWFDWDADGSLASGPWAPPIAIIGEATTGNGQQSIAGVWQPLEDSGTFTPQGLPFDVTGTVLSLVDNSFEGFSYYPNPTTNILNVNAKANIENISIFNVLGQELITVAPGNINAKVDMSGLSNGMYVMKATVNGTVGSFNIVKR
ncbi:MAG: T9SS type A sorting domain-containing protein [Flavobacteriaceae bacterium]|nr:T9SS type A sorting domain-containing protein [Flavobacteriaceae bacterium]